MAAGCLKFRFCFLLLAKVILCVSGGQNISAEPGQNIILTCRTLENRPVLVVQWSRTDLESDYVLLYRDDQINTELQHPSFLNRVDLQDRQMKDGDVSLVLKNVTINDGGTYECRVQAEGSREKKLLSTIILNVRLPGDQDGGDQDGGDQDGGGGRGHPGLIALLVVALVLVVVIIAAVICCIKKKKKKIKLSSYHLSTAGEPHVI